jgi:hypothetical protein
MNSPIKAPPHLRPQARPSPATSEPPVSNNRPLSGNPRRGDLERLRPAWNQPAQQETLNADGLFFSQLLVPPVSEEPDHSGFSGSGFNLLPPGDGVPTQLIDELAQRLPNLPDGPFNVTLLMPHLGEVQVNANKHANQWNIELGFARKGLLKRLQPHQRACENALADALGQDVDLSFHEELQA